MTIYSFSFYPPGNQSTRVDSSKTSQKKCGIEERMILVKASDGFSRCNVKAWRENNTYLIPLFIIGNV